MKDGLITIGVVCLLATGFAFVVTVFHWASATFDQRMLEACVKACGERGIASNYGDHCSCRDPR